MLMTEGVRAVMTSHNSSEPGDLAKEVFVFQMEQTDLRHLESIFMFQIENLLTQRTSFEKVFCEKMSKDLVKVIRNVPHFFEKHLPQADDRLLEHLEKLMDLETSLWDIHSDYLQEPSKVVGAFQSEVLRIWGLTLNTASLRAEFNNDLISKMKASVQNHLFPESDSLGAVTSLQIPGKTNYLPRRSVFCKKLVEDIEETNIFSTILLAPELMEDVLDLSRFLDLDQPIWLQGPPLSGKRTILDLSCHLLNFELHDLKVCYIDQNSVLERSSDKSAGPSPGGKHAAGNTDIGAVAAKWLRSSNVKDPRQSQSSNSESFSRSMGGESHNSTETLGNPLLERLKHLFINSFFLAINQSKKSVLLISDDLFEFENRRCVDEVMAVLQSLVTPFEMLSCFSKIEVKNIVRETRKLNRKKQHHPKFDDYFR